MATENETKLSIEERLRKGEEAYEEWRQELHANPEYQAIYEEEAVKKELWLQLVEARQEAGLTQVEMAQKLGVSQAQVARIEKVGYDAYTLKTLRRYIQALGPEFSLRVEVVRSEPPRPVGHAA